jgi:hypothetical protein
MTLREAIASGNLADLAAFCDGLDETARVREVRTLGKSDLSRLYELAGEGREPVALDYLVPASLKPSESAEWIGRNSAPAFKDFSKVFTRGDGPLIGYNKQPWQWAVGPGYFLAEVDRDRPSQFRLDYTRLPPRAPPGWPALLPNESWRAALVYGRMIDFLRPVGKNLAVGAAYTVDGAFRGYWFAFVRGPAFDASARA